MPSFTYANDQGQTVTVNRDVEPSDAELDQLFAQQAPRPAAADVPASVMQFAGPPVARPAMTAPAPDLEVMDYGLPAKKVDIGPRPTVRDAIRKAIELSAGGAFGSPSTAQINQLYLTMQHDYDKASTPPKKSERDKAYEIFTNEFIFENKRLPDPKEARTLYQRAATAGTRAYNEGFMVRDANGNFAGFTFVDATDGKVKVRKLNGQMVDLTQDYIPATASSFQKDVLPINDFMKLRGQLTDDEISLNRMARYAEKVQGLPVGIDRLANEWSSRFRTLFGSKVLTPEQINQALAKGELQGLIGATRIATVGGGVMTEQDAIRVLQRLGGDVDALQNPEIVRRAIADVYAERYRRYQDNVNFYNMAVENYYGRPNSAGAVFHKTIKPLEIDPLMQEGAIGIYGMPRSLSENKARLAELEARAKQKGP